MTKWTDARVGLLREMRDAGKTMAEAAAAFEVSVGTIACIASRYRIKFGRRHSMPVAAGDFAEAARRLAEAEAEAAAPANDLRSRWARALPAMKDAVRADVLASASSARGAA